MDLSILREPAIKAVNGKYIILVSQCLTNWNFPSHFSGIRKLGKVLITKRLLFRKIAIMPIEKMKENSGTTGNIPIYTNNATNMVTRPADSNAIVIIKLNYKLQYRGQVFFESVRPVFLQSI